MVTEEKGEVSLKIALLVPGLLGDKSFFDAANEACPLIEAELGATTKVVEMGLDQTKWYPTFVDFCEQDYDLILTVSPAVDDILNDVAAEYPKQLFFNIGTGSQEQELEPNVYSISTKSNEMSFLAGSVAAKDLEKFAIGVDSDQALALKDSAPESAARIITSAVNYTPQYTLNAVKRFMAEEIPFGTKEILGLKEGGVGVTKNEYYEKLMSEESRKEVEEIEKKVAAGEITIIKTSVMPTEELEKIRESVRP